jgi:Domain of unknown function (DUF5655)
MIALQDWRTDRASWIRILRQKTGAGLTVWNRRIRAKRFHQERDLRHWLSEHRVGGYAQQLLVMERFGYPDFITCDAGDLITRQYADRPQLRPILDAIVDAVRPFGRVVIQARKTGVSLVSPRRTFARVQPTTKGRVDLGLRLDGQKPVGRLLRNAHDTMRLRITLATRGEVDSEAIAWLRRAYLENS